MDIEKIHHIAIICSDYELSKHFYTKILPFTIQAEHYRAERQSFKLDLCLNGNMFWNCSPFLRLLSASADQRLVEVGIWPWR